MIADFYSKKNIFFDTVIKSPVVKDLNKKEML